MSFVRVFVAVCPYCGFDVAHTMPAADGFRVICAPDLGGCGAESNKSDTEAGAVAQWNKCPVSGGVLDTASRLRFLEGQV